MKGGILFYDGQFDDARMNISILLTALSHGATLANYVEVVAFEKREGKILAAVVKDRFRDKIWNIRAASFVNATGPFADSIRHLDDPNLSSLLVGSAGSHILLDNAYTPEGKGVLIPKTADGRLLFMLPWQGSTLVGTTDVPTEIIRFPKPSESEIRYLLAHLEKHLGLTIHKKEIKAAWSGIRPLISDPQANSTAEIARDFKIEIRKSGLCSIVGGKWTSFRKMAESVLDTLEAGGVILPKRSCVTAQISLAGADGYFVNLKKSLQGEFSLPDDVSEHLANSYGSRARDVAHLAVNEGLQGRLLEGHPYLRGEVLFAVREEFACTALDLLYRRIPLAALDQEGALKALPEVIKLMAGELHWDDSRQQEELNDSRSALFLPILK